MTIQNKIQLFEQKKVRTIWDDEREKWYFAVIDVVEILTGSVNPADYIKKMKKRDTSLSQGWGQIVTPLSVQTPGGKQKINFADTEGIFRIIQSIPSPKAEPFKQWMASVTNERLDQIQDPELSTKDISVVTNPETLREHAEVARQGGQARNARLELGQKTGQKVVTSLNAKNIKTIIDKKIKLA